MNKISKQFILLFISVFGFLLCSSSLSYAQQLIYHPVNPAFGGSPLNYSWLLNSANSQNKFQKSTDYSFYNDPLANFQQSLQRQVLSELTQSIIQNKFGDHLNLNQKNELKFGEFNIDVNPGIGGINIRIFNTSTGEETNITIPNVN